ncbi:MAG: DUF3662 domain-containing protein [Chloroflexi bacterium]|nr:DUF3662 domain-containing protein [Chloroflexota bacterium]
MKRPVQTAGISYKAIEMNLREIESRLQTLIEVDLLKVLPGRRVEDVIVQKLATAIQQNRIVEGGVTTIPDVYMLALNPETAKTWMDERLLTVILNSITTVAHEAGFKFTISPTVTVTTDDRIHITDVEITTSHRIETMAETNATPLDTGSLEAAGEKIPENSSTLGAGWITNLSSTTRASPATMLNCARSRDVSWSLISTPPAELSSMVSGQVKACCIRAMSSRLQV